MRCRKAQKLISARLDGELRATLNGLLEGHLAGCPDCRAFLADVAGFTADLDGLAAPEPQWGFSDRILARFPREGVEVGVSRTWLESLRPAPVGLGAVAFSFGVLLTVMVGGLSSSTEPSADSNSGTAASAYAEVLSESSFDEQLLALLSDAED